MIIEFQNVHQIIFDIFNSKSSAVEKWVQIANIINDKNKFIVDIYHYIKKSLQSNQLSLNYDDDLNRIQEQIQSESNLLRKASFIISSLHQIIYNLMTQTDNYLFKLNGNDEMAIIVQPVVYYINMSIKNEQNIFFHAFILLYALESLFTKYFYVGVDFEYTNKKIKLAQLNFEHSVSNSSIIMMVSPDELETDMFDNFVDLIMCNNRIKKILHGSDSLDIPYVYSGMLRDDTIKIIKFTKTLIDTRFICEYYKLNLPQSDDNKCSIYDIDADRSAIFYFKLISQEQQDKLSALLDSMPPPHDIQWNIHKMPESQILYAQYDVIYLKHFFYRMINVAVNNSNRSEKETITLYKYILTELTQFFHLESRGITELKNKCKSEVDVANNYFTKQPNNTFRMIQIFEQVSANIIIQSPYVEIDNIMKVNHFRKIIMFIIKRIVYGHISRKCKIYKDKNTIWTDKLDNNFIFEYFETFKFKYLLIIFKQINQQMESRVLDICKY